MNFTPATTRVGRMIVAEAGHLDGFNRLNLNRYPERLTTIRPLRLNCGVELLTNTVKYHIVDNINQVLFVDKSSDVLDRLT